MIITACPLRISLVGGSTDHPKFLSKYGAGAVISFASNLHTYITLHQDIFGATSLDKKYIINYSKRESVYNIYDIENELVRNCFDYLNVEHLNCFMTSDVFSAGSGLASSSAYLLALIKSIYALRNEHITEFEVCKLAEKIEKTFNPLVGQQDFYGSMGGLKKIRFYNNQDPEIRYLSANIFNQLDMYLIYTGVLRSSTTVLESLDIDKSVPLLKDVEDLESAINTSDLNLFHTVINRTWSNKKETSKYICKNELLIDLDNKLINDPNVLSHKLLGAGNGGYFLIFTEKDKESIIRNSYINVNKIHISNNGLTTTNLYDTKYV
jgi:D-glycero-alpha-D-manno-heptose-7-phosphate kinase